jgi:Ser/Thr protein kinase RdoA (MazF antagonist)/uridine kinase
VSSTADDRIAEEALREWLGDGATRTPIAYAMNGSVWTVSSGAGRFVLKIADASEEAGLVAAAWLDERGLRTGGPVRMTVRGDRLVALLRFIDGRELEHSTADTDLLGETLGRAHSLLADAPVPEGLERWPWSWLDPTEIDEPALRSAAERVIEAADRLAPAVTHGILHGDPNQGSFLASEAGVALIDWGAACHGPLLYDAASAWLFTDKRVLAAYARTAPIGADEIALTAPFLDLRWAVQAWYFSCRIRRRDLTGIAGDADNEKGLADARWALLGQRVGSTTSRGPDDPRTRASVKAAASSVVAEVRSRLRDRRDTAPFLVGVDGASGAGKSTIAALVARDLDAVVVESDDFFAAEITDAGWAALDGRGRADAAIDWRRLRREALEPLLAGRVASWHPFDFAGIRPDGTYPMAPEPVVRAPRGVIVLEGAYSCRPELADLIALTVLVVAPVDERRRRIADRETNQEWTDAWHARWDPAEEHYFTEVRPPSSFDVVVQSDPV